MPTNKQRREAARRHLERQLQRRQEREARRKKVTLIASVAGAVVLIGVVIGLIFGLGAGNNTKPQAGGHRHTAGSSSGLPSTSPLPTTSASTAAASYPCTWTTSGTAAKKVAKPPTTRPPKSGAVTVSVATNRGLIRLKLNRGEAPCTVASFVSLVKQKFYNKTPCHRLVTSGIYVLQCGDPTGTGTGGPGYTIPDEASGHETYPAGVVAMARSSAPHSGGSQFFIVYKNSPNLMQNLGAQQYTEFGAVTKGLGVVRKVAAKGAVTGTDGKPKLPITITSMHTGG